MADGLAWDDLTPELEGPGVGIRRTDADGLATCLIRLDAGVKTHALFAGLHHPWARDSQLQTGGADPVDRRLEAVQVEVVEGDAGGAEVDGGVELVGRANEEVDFGRVNFGVS